MIAQLLAPFMGYIALGLLAVTLVTNPISYWKGRSDGKALYKAQIEREIAGAIRSGDDARAKALRDFDSRSPDDLPDDGFRRP